MPKRSLLIGLLGVLAVMVGGMEISVAADSRSAVKKARNMPEIRGAIVYKAYCVLCHGERGDGKGRAAKLYSDQSLALTPHPRAYHEKVIRGGGSVAGLSAFMPAWRDELSDQQIDDLLYYLDAVRDPVARGEVVFKTNCVLCHGVKGDGKGRASVLYNPPPADLTRSDKNDQYKIMIITLGGATMGRSEVMPVWGEQISAQEIRDVVAYLKTILVVPAPESLPIVDE